MRPSQQKNRMRGRGRKQPNSLSRNYESNGPDVKIRGNATHVAEKYATLARDAAASGDRVVAENYLQHAEHYNRIIAAAAAAAGRHEENAAGKGPQPELSAQDRADGDDGEYGRNADQRRPEAQGGHDGANQPDETETGEIATEGDGRNRRDGRRRRPKKADGNGAQSHNGSEEGGAQTDGGKRKMTDDAARLPDNLIGGAPSAPETSESKVAHDD